MKIKAVPGSIEIEHLDDDKLLITIEYSDGIAARAFTLEAARKIRDEIDTVIAQIEESQ